MCEVRGVPPLWFFTVDEDVGAAMNRSRAAYVALWLLSGLLAVTGVVLLAIRQVSIVIDESTASVEVVDVMGIGTAFLCTGVLVLVVVLVLEVCGLAPRAPAVEAIDLEDIRRRLG